MEVIGTVFTKRNKYGDFLFMLKDPEYADSLFIYNENTELFISKSRKRGAGNAVIRPFRFTEPPRSSPIVTGTLREGGFDGLTDEVKALIDAGIEEIKNKIKEWGFKRVFYSAEVENGIIGQNIFVIGYEVRKYITDRLHELRE